MLRNTRTDPATSDTLVYSTARRSSSGPRAARRAARKITAPTTSVASTTSGQGRNDCDTARSDSITVMVVAADTTARPSTVSGTSARLASARRRA